MSGQGTFNLSRRQVLTGIGAAGIAAGGVGVGTRAYLTDQEQFANDQLTAGSLDLKVAWQAHYSDRRGAERSFARMVQPGETPDLRLPPAENGQPIELVFIDAPGDEDGADSRPEAMDGGRQFLRNTLVERANGGLFDGGTDLCGSSADVPDDEVLFELSDLKPGDFGFGLFGLELCSNPGFLWLTGGISSANENGLTEPEADDPDEDGDADSTAPADVELLDELRVAVGVGKTTEAAATDPAGTLFPRSETTGNIPEPARQFSLREFLQKLHDGGLELDGDTPAPEGGGTGRNCFSAGASHYVSVVWWLPIDHGNEVQTDSVAFDLGFYTEQCRHNSGDRETLQPDQTAKLLATEPTDGAYFGADTAIDGGTMVASADGRDLAGENSGAAYAFDHDGQQWNRTGPLRPSAGVTEAGDLFGEAVAIDGNTIVVGAPGDDENGSDAGAAYVFGRDGGNWTRIQRLSPADADAGDSFGQDVAVGSDLVAVGADGKSSKTSEAGALYLFERDGSGWSQAAKLAPADLNAEDYFGARVGVADGGETVVTGAYGDDEAGERAGAAYVFGRDGGGWSQEAKLMPQDGNANGLFGSSVAIDGDTVLVGAFGTLNGDEEFAGAAYAFTRENGSFSSPVRLEPLTPSRGEFFGWEVGLHEEVAVVGAYGNSDGGDETGAAYLFSRSGGSWTEQTKLRPTDLAAGDRFGVSVATDEGTTVVTADGDGTAGENTGAAYVFREGES